MTRALRIAVLECDTPIPPVKERLGGYGDIFTRLLNQGLQSSNNSTIKIQEISRWHVVDNPVYPNPNEYDALLLSGSSMCLPAPQEGPLAKRFKNMIPLSTIPGS
ncbi:uncharacterized protein N7482_009207 [Penicillium canariense]|uniref:Glutamine amidotransferase domain-containing protein n=1 Tax=Penicillium canariense TaxID=189055 RepID=A0A9W9HSM6_9EURO|nr:uncharacterized protein N7482_009207 [Penicillium canariense]KAJ5152729.1 hypothetical protein N7482_009207 [Penicillium canariense]